MQLSTNFTTIFLAKSPRARGAWVPATSAPAGLGPCTGRPRTWSGNVYRLQSWDRSRGAREPGCRLPRRSPLDAHAGYRTVDEQAAKVNYYSLYLPIYPSHNGCGCIWVSFPSERTAMDNRIGAVVARERKALGLTQEELARRLGVTKAAVSKWELGQSMPDAALLPSIAAQFALSIDELFDWRAHLTDAEIETCAQTAREKLAADASQGATYVRMRAREHRSCWKLLVRLASELLSAANHVAFGICQDAPDDERAQERARETMCALAEDARCFANRCLMDAATRSSWLMPRAFARRPPCSPANPPKRLRGSRHSTKRKRIA